MSEHTPPPYAVSGTDEAILIVTVKAHNGVSEVVARCNKKENAEFIVSAANAREELLVSIKAALKVVVNAADRPAYEIVNALVEILQEAIAKAGAGE